MLMIRLQRIGKRGQAYFRVVVIEHTSRPKGEFLELLGTYNPHQKEFKVKKDRIDYWVSKGAKPSPTVNNLMVNYKVWDKPKVQSWKPKKGKAQNEKGKVETKPETAKAEELKPEEPKTEEKAPEQPAEAVPSTQ